MVTIEECSEYNVRAMKSPDFKNKSHGYNFAYPVMNTIDICDLFISGGKNTAPNVLHSRIILLIFNELSASLVSRLHIYSSG